MPLFNKRETSIRWKLVIKFSWALYYCDFDILRHSLMYNNKTEPYDVLACSYEPAFVWAQTRLKYKKFIKNRTRWPYRLSFYVKPLFKLQNSCQYRASCNLTKTLFNEWFFLTYHEQRKFANPFLPPKWSSEHYSGFDISFMWFIITVQTLKLLKY